MLKNNNDNKKDVSRLYRLYQEKRDNIPSTVLWRLLNTTKAKNHTEFTEEQDKKETQINTILQAAKIPSSQSDPSSDTQKLSLKDRINNAWQNLFSPSFGGKQWVAISAVLVLMVVINLVPSSQKFDPYLDVAYLEDCNVCGQLAMGSTIKVRNIDLNANNIESANNAAKFGRLVLDLELINSISSTPNIDTANSALINAVKSLADKKENQPVIEYLNQFDARHAFSSSEINQTIQFLNQTFEEQADSDLYHAGQWFERLRITNDSALQTQQFAPIESALGGIETLQSKLQKNKMIDPDVLSAMEQLSQLQQSNRYDAEQAQQISVIVKKILPLLNM